MNEEHQDEEDASYILQLAEEEEDDDEILELEDVDMDHGVSDDAVAEVQAAVAREEQEALRRLTDSTGGVDDTGRGEGNNRTSNSSSNSNNNDTSGGRNSDGTGTTNSDNSGNGDTAQSQQQGGDTSQQPSRWTCDACGCNTNTQSDRSCTVCGTPNGSSILRRAGYARAGLIARRLNEARNAANGSNRSGGNSGSGSGGPPSGLGADLPDFGFMAGDAYEFLERHAFAAAMGGSSRGTGRGSSGTGNGDTGNDDDVDMGAPSAADVDEHTMAVLAMEVAGMTGGRSRIFSSSGVAAAAAAAGLGPSSSILQLDAARSGLSSAPSPRDVETLEPDELWRVAHNNSSMYRPKWMSPSDIGNPRSSNGIEVGDGERKNVAHLPVGTVEGRALRAQEPFPRSAPYSSFSTSTRDTNGPSASQRRSRRIFGFRVAFEHPNKEDGKKMGGCYLIGVTTGSFTSFSDRNSLQSSPHFWGIEDAGRKFEGSRYYGSREGSRHRHSSNAADLSREDAPRNGDDVLFGSKEVVTCVVDMEARTLTFWRDEDGGKKLLGTLVSNLPRTGQLFPVVVPYNSGSTVAITSMTEDPLPLLKSFTTEWKEAQEEKKRRRREELVVSRSVLIKKGAITSRLQSTLRDIFAGYMARTDPKAGSSLELNNVEASRLWYRCGLKLSNLMDVFQTQAGKVEKTVTFADFLQVINDIVDYDERHFGSSNEASQSEFRVGDRVELVEDYERFGDAVSGPLVPGERGVIVELQRKSEGERQSIRVLHDARRWWYQPQAIVSEQSRLIDTPGVWCIKQILRTHGYDPKTLHSMIGENVSTTSWNVGDIVIPRKNARRVSRDNTSYAPTLEPTVGRIIVDNTSSQTSLPARGRTSGSVLVEFINRTFAEGASIPVATSQLENKYSLESKRVPYSKLMHTSVCHGLNAENSRSGSSGVTLRRLAPDNMLVDGVELTEDDSSTPCLSDGIQSDLRNMKFLDASAIGRIIKDLSKHPSLLGGLFQAGLIQNTLDAVDCALYTLKSNSSNDSISQAIHNLGKLALLLTKQVFLDGFDAKSSDRDSNDQDFTMDHHDFSASSTGPSYQLQHSTRQRRGNSAGGYNTRNRRSAERARERISSHERRRMLASLMNSANAASGDSITVEDFFSRGRLSMEDDPDIAMEDAGLSFVDDTVDNDHDNSPPDGESQLNVAFEEAGASLLDTLIRGRGKAPRQSSLVGKSPFLASSLKVVVDLGIVGNSKPWLTSLLDSLAKQLQRKQQSRDSFILRNVTDEDGWSLIKLAISLGCSSEIINTLIRFGAKVTKDELQLAVDANIPDTLSELLRHTPYVEGDLDLTSCSASVSKVVTEAIERQELQRQALRKECEKFLSTFISKMLEMAMVCRHLQPEGNSKFRRAVAVALVGDVELRALQKTEKTASSPTSIRTKEGYDCFSLMESVPIDILGGLFVDDENEHRNLISIFVLIEEFLSSKTGSDGRVGLTLLLTMLQRFPSLQLTSELERYRFSDLVSSHDANALSSLAEIQARLAESRKFRKNDKYEKDICVRCPAGHTAELHITKHSSFRCDICGCSLDIASIAFGCRQCDWDACESCTDRVEGGLLKAKYLHGLASTAMELLSDEDSSNKPPPESDDNACVGRKYAMKMLDCMKDMWNEATVTKLSIRILQGDHTALDELSDMLKRDGQITNAQFLMIILPALHSTMMGTTSINRSADSTGRISTSRRSKKPRVASRSSIGDHRGTDAASSAVDSREVFIRHMFKSLITGTALPESSQESSKPGSVDVEDNAMDESHEDDDLMDASGDDSDELLRRSRYRALSSVKSSNNSRQGQKPEFMRRLHQVLSLHESLESVRSSAKTDHIQVLKKPVKVLMSSQQQGEPVGTISLLAEPLVDVASLSKSIILFSSASLPDYREYCLSLLNDSAIIVDKTDVKSWRIGIVVSFNERNGFYHGVRFAASSSTITSEHTYVNFSTDFVNGLTFETKPTNLILAARNYIVVHRGPVAGMKLSSSADMDVASIDGVQDGGKPSSKESVLASFPMIGSRVESSVGASKSGESNSFVVIGDETAKGGDVRTYTLASDDGIVHTDVPYGLIRGDEHSDNGNGVEDESNSSLHRVRSARQSAEERLDQLSRSIPFFNSRRFGANASRSANSGNKNSGHVLRRKFSALSPVQSMRPVEISSHTDCVCAVGVDKKVRLYLNDSQVEYPPSLNVQFGTSNDPPAVFPSNTTLASLLRKIHEPGEFDVWRKDGHPIMFSVAMTQHEINKFYDPPESSTSLLNDLWPSSSSSKTLSRPGRKDDAVLYQNDQSVDSPSSSLQICEGIDEICIQVLDIIECLAEARESAEVLSRGKQDADTLDVFVNPQISKKLERNLESPLSVVASLLPEWCHALPSWAPKVFSYSSRKRLLEGSAYGVSRSTLWQQEQKINVSSLRSRAATLRARAVELMDQAFSGECQDPTALQLQADELYGMEEALRNKIASSYRNENWVEMGIESCKASVSREVLISDAIRVMNKYANDESLRYRRLEVRFEGESGFDAASGESAGVTRGYFSDVAEALQSAEVCAGASFSLMCPPTIDESLGMSSSNSASTSITGLACKLPLWIPDFDPSSSQVVPTPRAGQSSSIGLFPRPLSTLSPPYADVLRMFRLMGQLFATAMRDDFMFPLPLSASFLKLVTGRHSGHGAHQRRRILTSSDLPRPGFLGGEIFAVESTICSALDTIDQSDPSMTEEEKSRRYEEVASDVGFAEHLGLQYQCSFNDYFEDRAFVDPFDPSQGRDAHPLRPHGHMESVTIHNIREYISLAKDFVLHGGVVGQASAFRAGVEDFFPPSYLSLFTAEELQRDICGVGDNVDEWDEAAVKKLFKLDGKGSAEAFIAVASIGGNAEALSRRFGPTSPTIKYLVKALVEASPQMRRQFLSFVTSLPIQTRPWRPIEVVPIVSPSGDFQPMSDPSCLPRANTCARKLFLPKFESYESFSQVLWAVIREECKHKGFWEFKL